MLLFFFPFVFFLKENSKCFSVSFIFSVDMASLLLLFVLNSSMSFGDTWGMGTLPFQLYPLFTLSECLVPVYDISVIMLLLNGTTRETDLHIER